MVTKPPLKPRATLYTCYSEDNVPYQYVSKICEHTENMYPRTYVKIIHDNYDIARQKDETNLPKIIRNDWFSETANLTFTYQLNFPSDYEENDLTTYPVYFNVYGGPDSQKVTTRFTRGFDLNYMTSVNADLEGETGAAISIYIDVRGSSNKGDAMRFGTYLTLGQHEIDDVREFAAALLNGEIADLPASRILHHKVAIWGWSYGGFFTSHMAGRQDDNFMCGVAVAPVSNFDKYDTLYTERYMQSKDDDSSRFGRKVNSEGYEKSEPMRLVSQDRNDGYFMKFSLIHGTADDNVHFQNSAEISKKLIQEGFEFDAYFYADENHSIYSTTSANKHVYRLIHRKFQECFEI